MAEHEPSIGATSQWFTPPEYARLKNGACSERRIDVIEDVDFCRVLEFGSGYRLLPLVADAASLSRGVGNGSQPSLSSQ